MILLSLFLVNFDLLEPQLWYIRGRLCARKRLLLYLQSFACRCTVHFFTFQLQALTLIVFFLVLGPRLQQRRRTVPKRLISQLPVTWRSHERDGGPLSRVWWARRRLLEFGWARRLMPLLLFRWFAFSWWCQYIINSLSLILILEIPLNLDPTLVFHIITYPLIRWRWSNRRHLRHTRCLPTLAHELRLLANAARKTNRPLAPILYLINLKRLGIAACLFRSGFIHRHHGLYFIIDGCSGFADRSLIACWSFIIA